MTRGKRCVSIGIWLAVATGVGCSMFAPTTQQVESPPSVAPAASQPTTRASSERRPVPSAAESTALAAQLREAYSKPPADWPKPNIDEGIEFVELGLIPPPKFPAENPFTQAKADLGKTLFFDPRLSGSGQFACASCHDAELGWGDGKALSFGHSRTVTKRNAPSINNAAQRKFLFWDGRAASLEEQALGPITNTGEMNADPTVIVGRLDEQPGYHRLFEQAFGDPKITQDRMMQAIATFERTIVSRPSPFDHFLRGERDALSDSAVRGLHLFRTDARCINCHSGPLFTDERFHNLALTYYGRSLQDLGRYDATHDPSDVGRFKTPSLRNVARNGPYMHNGLFDLRGVLNMYNAGMATIRRQPGQENDPLFPIKSPHIQRLRLSEQQLDDLRAFLESLTELRLRVRPPVLPGLSPASAPSVDE